VSFTIPKLASGGIVTRPTLALIGEAGPEAVVPLGPAGLGYAPSFTVNVYTNNPATVVGAIRRYEKSNSAAWRARQNTVPGVA
jgi:hypothetical protein